MPATDFSDPRRGSVEPVRPSGTGEQSCPENVDGCGDSPPETAGRTATDAALLHRFIHHRDRNAFAAIVARYQRLVMGVALRQVGDRHRAEDVFQATFLVLAERAGRIRKPAALASWLHGAARRIGLQALSEIGRHTAMPDPATPLAVDPPVLQQMQEAFERQVLDEELARLPERFRLPLVLHYLEGLTGREVANRLGVSEDAIEGRLRQGRNRLRERLLRHGIGLGVVTAAFQFGEQLALASTAALVEATTDASLAWVNHQSLEACTANAARLAGQELATMTATKTLTWISCTAALCLGVGIAGALAFGEGGGTGAGGQTGASVDTLASGPLSPAAPPLSSTSGVLLAAGDPPPSDGGTSTPHLLGLADAPAAQQPTLESSPKSYARYSPAREAIESLLDKPGGSSELLETPFSEAMASFEQRHNLTIRFDRERLAENGVTLDHAVTAVIPEKATIREALELVLQEIPDTDYIIQNGVLTITTQDQAGEFQETVIYELRDLGTNLPAEDVVQLVLHGTSGYWLDRDGTGGTVQPLPGGIMVRNTQRVHREVVALLDQLRQFSARQDLPPVERNPNALHPPLPTGGGFSGGFGGGGGGGGMGGSGGGTF